MTRKIFKHSGHNDHNAVCAFVVIPATAGIHCGVFVLCRFVSFAPIGFVDPGLRRGDGWVRSVIPAEAGIYFLTAETQRAQSFFESLVLPAKTGIFQTTETDRGKQRPMAREALSLRGFAIQGCKREGFI